jgi:hypothetical protein
MEGAARSKEVRPLRHSWDERGSEVRRTRMGVEQVTGPEVYHGEGPVWYSGWGGLRFVDMLAVDCGS